jgi:hypothetical protein
LTERDKSGLHGGAHSGKHTSHAETVRIQTERLSHYMPRDEARKAAEQSATRIHRDADAQSSDRGRR